MTEEEILESVSKIEVREGVHRTIKSYALRDSTLDEERRRILLANFERYGAVFKDEPTDMHTLFNDPSKDVIIEIGFGMGSSTQLIARDRDEYNYLGLEVYLNGYVKLMRDVAKMGLDNIRLMRFNAVDVLERMVPDSSIKGFHIFFPDPWQKKRHHKRRLIQPAFVHLLTQKLVPGGYIYAVTDWEEYAEWMMEVFSSEPGLINPAGAGSYSAPIPWRPETKFERKGLEKEHVIRELWFERPLEG